MRCADGRNARGRSTGRFSSQLYTLAARAIWFCRHIHPGRPRAFSRIFFPKFHPKFRATTSPTERPTVTFLGTDRQLPQKFPEIDLGLFTGTSAITSLPIGPLSLPAGHQYGSPVSIQTKASRRKGRQTSRQAERRCFIHRNINPFRIRLRKLDKYAAYEPVRRRQYRGLKCHGKAQARDREVGMFFYNPTHW